MSACTKSALLGAVVLLSSALSSEAAKISFHRASDSAYEARRLATRGFRVSKTQPSRISREQHYRLEERESATDPESQLSKDLYTAPITMGGKEYTVVLDMSYSDIWLDTAPPDGYEETDVKIQMNQAFTEGTLELEGTVGIAPLKFGTYEVEEQAFLNIHDDSGDLEKMFGFNGFFGLGVSGFNPSPITDAMHGAEGGDSTSGQTVLEHIFASGSSAGHFIAVDLGRKDDTRDIEGINLSIGEYPEEWSEIQETPTIDLYNYSGTEKWTALIDGVSLAGSHLTLKSWSSDVPKGSAVAHFTITEPDSYLPEYLFDEVYGSIDGAESFTTEKGEKRWLVPCLTKDILAITIDQRTFPIHPLDLNEIWHDSDDKPEALKDYTVCVSSFRISANSSTGYDITLGSTFMRNVQAVFGYPIFNEQGEIAEEPYMLLQADTEEDKATTQVTTIRGTKLKELPEELDPRDAVKLMNGKSSGKSSSNKAKEASSSADNTAAPSGETAKPTSNVLNAQGQTGSSDSGFSKYMPAVLGLLAANLLVALSLVVLGILNYIKKGASTKKAPTTHIYAPVKGSEQHYVDQ